MSPLSQPDAETDLQAAAALFKALADPNRLRALQVLGQPPVSDCGGDTNAVCACDLETALGLSQPTISHHMRLLVGAGLVTATKQGKWTHYALNAAGFAHARALLETLAPRPEGTL